MLVLSESFPVFESRIACRCNRFPSRRRRRAALSIWHQLTQSIQRGESSFQINSNENSKRKLIISTQSAMCSSHLLVSTDHEIHTCARSYATLGWISWKSMHLSWKDDSPLWILCVWGSNENAIILNAIKVFQAKLLAIKRKNLICHQGIIKLVL